MQGRKERSAAATLAARASAGGLATALAGAQMNVRSCNRFKKLPCNSWPRAAAARALQRPRPAQHASRCPVAPHEPRSLRSLSRPCALSACSSLSALSRSHLWRGCSAHGVKQKGTTRQAAHRQGVRAALPAHKRSAGRAAPCRSARHTEAATQALTRLTTGRSAPLPTGRSGPLRSRS